jgi:hypothetical protein
MMANDFVTRRERALHAHITSVETAAKQWAHRSSNGGLVWRVATELLDDVWCEWRHASVRPNWHAHGVIRAITTLGDAVGDAAVAGAVTIALGALADYTEPEA